MNNLLRKYSIYITLLLVFWISSGMVNHPLKMSTTKFSAKGDQLSFQVRMYSDDVSSGMSQITKKAFPYEIESLNASQKKVLEKYLSENLGVKINSALTTLKCTALKNDFSNPDAPVIIMEGVVTGNYKASQISTMAVKNTLLFAYSPEQKNIVNILNIKNSDQTLIFNNEEDLNFKNVDF